MRGRANRAAIRSWCRRTCDCAGHKGDARSARGSPRALGRQACRQLAAAAARCRPRALPPARPWRRGAPERSGLHRSFYRFGSPGRASPSAGCTACPSQAVSLYCTHHTPDACRSTGSRARPAIITAGSAGTACGRLPVAHTGALVLAQAAQAARGRGAVRGGAAARGQQVGGQPQLARCQRRQPAAHAPPPLVCVQ